MSTPYNHRGTPIAGNHRPTPRIARIVEQHLNQKIEDASERLLADQPLLNYTMGGQARYTEEGAGQHVIDRYRELRDAPPATTAFGKFSRNMQIEDDADNIREALQAHREEQGY